MSRFCPTLLLASALFLCLPSVANAQVDDYVPAPPISARIQYDTIYEDNSIVRSDNSYRVVHIEHKENATGINLHTFIIKSLPNGNETVFTTRFNAHDSTQYDVYITDMELHNGECYFCGTLYLPIMDVFNHYISLGLVGHFSPQAMTVSSGVLLFNTVEETTSLTHLAISTPSRHLISAVGVRENGNKACLAEVAQISSSVWNAKINHIPSLEKIYFSDVLNNFDSITLLAQFRCNNNHTPDFSDYDHNHQVFLLDRFSLEGCSHDISPSTTHYMAHYSLDNQNYKFHHNLTPMLLCNIYETDFGVAFGVERDEMTEGGIRYFSFSNIWQFDSSIYYKTGRSPEVIDIGSLKYANRPFFLSWDMQNRNRIVSIPDLSDPNHFVSLLSSTSNRINSLARLRSGTYIDITGHDDNSLFNLYSQDLDMLDRSSCFVKTNRKYSIFKAINKAMLVVEWGIKHEIGIFQWNIADISYITKFSPNTLCSKHFND